MQPRIEDYFHLISTERLSPIKKFHAKHLSLINEAKGSASKHQAWKGGYRNHLEQCLALGDHLYREFDFPVKVVRAESVVIVLYFHDIEKIFKYTNGEIIDKWEYYTKTLLEEYGINFTLEELNALRYVHGEGDDYCGERVMNELAGFCHAVDVLSARCFHNLKDITRGQDVVFRNSNC